MTGASGTITIQDDLWEHLVKLTGGAAAACYQCGTCTATCPWGAVGNNTIPVRSFMRQAQLGLEEAGEALWMCTTCAQCEAHCPREVNVSSIIVGLRSLAWEQRQTPAGLPSLLWSIFWNNNPWSQPPSRRSLWAAGLNLPEFDPGLHEILLYIGCTSSYDGRAQKVARSVVQLLSLAGVAFGVLGDDEPCCGEAVRSVGHIPYFHEAVKVGSGEFKRRDVTRLVTISPHCYDVFTNHYPQYDGFEPRHYTQYLASLIDQGRLRFNRPINKMATFHDPCYLARYNRESDAPRKVLAALPGISLVEMAHSGAETICCGGGGGRMWIETEPAGRFADLRIREAQSVGAEVVVTACPFCIACLEDSVKSQGISNIQVMDVAELAIQGSTVL